MRLMVELETAALRRCAWLAPTVYAPGRYQVTETIESLCRGEPDEF